MRLKAVARFPARTAGRFTSMSARLCCAGSCGLSFIESAMIDSLPDATGGFQGCDLSGKGPFAGTLPTSSAASCVV